MSRKRQQRKTCIINGEGKAEQAFLRHLNGLYAQTRKCHVEVASGLYSGSGGSPVDVAVKMFQACKGRSFDYGFILIDSDTLTLYDDELFSRAKKKIPTQQRCNLPKQYRSLVSTPCLESLLLEVHGIREHGETSLCKKAFYRKFNKDVHMLTQSDWAKHFSKGMLEANNLNIPTLMNLLKVFSGNFDIH